MFDVLTSGRLHRQCEPQPYQSLVVFFTWSEVSTPETRKNLDIAAWGPDELFVDWLAIIFLVIYAESTSGSLQRGLTTPSCACWVLSSFGEGERPEESYFSVASIDCWFRVGQRKCHQRGSDLRCVSFGARINDVPQGCET